MVEIVVATVKRGYNGNGRKLLPRNRPPKDNSVTGHNSVVAGTSFFFFFFLGVMGLTFSTCINSLTCTFLPEFCK